MDLKESFFDTGEVKLHVMEANAGTDLPALVLLHGSTGSWGGWYRLLPRLAEGWHIYAIDQRGHGLSGRAKDLSGYHISAYARDAQALLRGFVRQPAVVYGHSWGAVTAALAAGALCAEGAGELVRGLVLEDPPVRLRRETPVMNPFMDYFAWLRGLLLADPSPKAIAAVLREQNPDAPAAALEPWAASLANVDPRYLDALLTRTAVAKGVDFDQAIRDICCPVVLLQADLAKGGAMEEVDVDLFRRNARDLEVVYFAGVGHGIHDERQEEVLAIVEKMRR